jgi:hypothetical protein
MTTLTLDGHTGGSVEIDLCRRCRAIWFDRFENLQLAPRSIVRLFREMTDDRETGGRLPASLACPRCLLPLKLTHDMQRTTRFEYWRCEQDHGRFITFLNFLREKDFVRPLTPEQIAELRDNVQTINCANCGAPIDLAKASVCPHCGSALTMLDMKHVGEALAHYQTADAPRPLDPALPILLERERRNIQRRFASFEPPRSPESLIEAGIRAVLAWLKVE